MSLIILICLLAILRDYLLVGTFIVLTLPVVICLNPPHILYARIVTYFAVEKLRHVHAWIKDFGETAQWLGKQTRRSLWKLI